MSTEQTTIDAAIQSVRDTMAQPARPTPDDQTPVLVLTEKEMREILVRCERTARIEGQADAYQECAKIADNGCLVPPDGGSPTEEERQVAANIAQTIMGRLDHLLF